IGINSLLENKNIADDSILNDNLSNNVVSDYPATTGYVSLANQFRHSVQTNQGWIGISEDSKSLLYTTFDGVRRWTKDMQSTIYDAKFNHFDNTLTVLTHSPDPTGNHFFTITLLDIKGNTLSTFRDSLAIPDFPLDTRAPSPYSLKIVKNNNDLWTMVSVNPLAYLSPLDYNTPTTNIAGIKIFLSNKNTSGDWSTGLSTQPTTTANSWIKSSIPNTIISTAGHTKNLKFISDFQFYLKNGKVAISTVTRHQSTSNAVGAAVYHTLSDMTTSSSWGSSFVQGVDLKPMLETPIFGIRENETFTKGIAGIGYSRFFPENNNEVLIPIRTTYAPTIGRSDPVAIVALPNNGNIRFPLSYSVSNWADIIEKYQNFYSPFGLRKDQFLQTDFSIFSELSLMNEGNKYLPSQISYDDRPFDYNPNTIEFNIPTEVWNIRTLDTRFNKPTYHVTKAPFLVVRDKSNIQPYGVGAIVFKKDINSDNAITHWGSGGIEGKIVSYGDYQKLADANPELLKKTVEEIIPNDLLILSKSNLENYDFGVTTISGDKSKIITIESKDTVNQNLNMKIVWRQKLYSSPTDFFYFEYSENVTISGFGKVDIPIFSTRAYNVFQINSISGNTKDIDISVEQKSGQPHYANLFELRFGYKTSNGTTIDLGSGGKNGFYTAEAIKTISAAGQGSRITKFSDMNLYVKMFAKTTATEEIWTYDKQEYYLLNNLMSSINSVVPAKPDIDNSNLNFHTSYFNPTGISASYQLEYFVNVPDDWDITWGFKSKVVMENIILEVTENVVDLANNKGIFLYFMDKNGSRVRITSNQTIITP
ncbi:MAG: hypothetical protein KFW07_01130, partial [Mycoplasmataceae bacterium]|nr:hypothetical protein [Mycoplasmataceae bacterium]